mmetsp:Transcript_24360/g.36236  ORF Transcript_24360/g.36236 Transcript_24360/m.36236 type:complete len:562 (+) Transcript_24360:79-1764(+)
MGKLLLRLMIIIPGFVAAFTVPKARVGTISNANLFYQRHHHHNHASLQLFNGKHAAAIAQSTSAIVTPSLGPTQLASSFSTVVLVATILKLLGLKSQARRIIAAASRMSAQLLVIGAFLTPLFAYTSSSPWKLAAWVTFIAAIASKEAVSRSRYTYKKQFLDSFISILGGVGLTLLHLVSFVLGRDSSSAQMNAQTIIPIAGMLFGNALTAASLAKKVLLQNFLEDFDRVELRLSRGASFWEASLPVIRDAVEAALMPTVNAMAATGIIFLPGMMTGQILGGQNPNAAALYQIMIYFAIGASSCLTAILMSLLVSTGVYDIKQEMKSGNETVVPNKTLQETSLRVVSNLTPADGETDTVLEVKNLTLQSTSLTIKSLIIGKCSRVGVVGRSGIGKSRLLRALSKLDVSKDGSIYLDGKPSSSIPISSWRSRVMWISQDRPALPGSPRDFYNSILSYATYQNRRSNNHKDPIEIAKRWNLSKEAWDQSWGSLSGGEAQRANLAIALSLEPDLLLLDESTSNCDKETTLSIEKTLMEMKTTIVIVSHSEEQVNRFCTSKLELQ